MKSLVILTIPLVAACGRGGFDVLAPPPDAVVDAAAPDAAPPVLSCAKPLRFAISAGATALSATSRLHGYDVFTVDGAGQLEGYSYTFDTDDLATAQLARDAGEVPLATNATGATGAISLGDDVLVAMPFGRPMAAGTSLIPLDAQLASRGTPAQYNGVYGAGGAIARNAGGELAFATQPTLQEIDVAVVSPLGATASATQKIVEGGVDLTTPTITAVGGSFLVVWNAAGSPSVVHAQRFDERLVAQTLIEKVSVDQTSGTEAPRAAYAAAADRYLFAWHQKVSGGGTDEVWVDLRDGNLAPVRAGKIAVQGVQPVIAAGSTDFLVVWQDASPSHLGAARVAMDGTITPVTVTGTGGTAVAWDLVVHNGQPALAWVEAGGTGPNLALDPLCP